MGEGGVGGVFEGRVSEGEGRVIRGILGDGEWNGRKVWCWKLEVKANAGVKEGCDCKGRERQCE